MSENLNDPNRLVTLFQYVLDELINSLAKAQAEIEKLRTRLELTATNGNGETVTLEIGECDGISCRDKTIRMQEAEIERMRLVVDAALTFVVGGWIKKGDKIITAKQYLIDKIREYEARKSK